MTLASCFFGVDKADIRQLKISFFGAGFHHFGLDLAGSLGVKSRQKALLALADREGDRIVAAAHPFLCAHAVAQAVRFAAQNGFACTEHLARAHRSRRAAVLQRLGGHNAVIGFLPAVGVADHGLHIRRRRHLRLVSRCLCRSVWHCHACRRQRRQPKSEQPFFEFVKHDHHPLCFLITV